MLETKRPLIACIPCWSKDAYRITSFFLLSSSLPTLHICKDQLEPITQRPHVRVHILLQFESLRHHLHAPVLHPGMLSGFEAEVEVPGVLGIDAEIVDGALRIGFGVGSQPAL